MTRYVCIHGHFYQPPRENPWLESIEVQASAYPFHDWNARIASECYGPNAFARLVGPAGRIISIVNNYARISFNFGPTLLSWLEQEEPEIYAAILNADRMSQEIYGGHGTAIAQAYNHIILPLANHNDRVTQVEWGVADFVRRFQRQPEGMWLAEAAVDLLTLEILVDFGIKFTVLAPNQAAAVRTQGSEEWHDVSGGRIDPRRAYRCPLPSGRTIDLFFYDGNIAKDVAFRGLLNSGETYANRLIEAFDAGWQEPQLVHVATDGESYGHHHRYGEMAIAYALSFIEQHELAQITNYGQFLELAPPSYEVSIFENSSWSCVHGVERWKSDCGCNSGGRDWHQGWRQPLRFALDELRDALIPIFEKEAAPLLGDPWKARNTFGRYLHDRSEENLKGFFEEIGAPFPKGDALQKALTLLEIQRHAMLMYTSCGWFFDEISGLETTQILRYASRAIQLATDLGHQGLEEAFLTQLQSAPSNLPEHGHGAAVYEAFVRPARVSLPRVAGHLAVLSLFEDVSDLHTIDCFAVEVLGFQSHQAGKMQLRLAQVRIRSSITHEEGAFQFAAIYIDDRNIHAYIKPFQGDTNGFQEFTRDVIAALSRLDVPGTIRFITDHFGTQAYTLDSLFRDKQEIVLSRLNAQFEERTRSFYREIYFESYPLMRSYRSAHFPIPPHLAITAELVINWEIQECFRTQPFDVERVESLAKDAHALEVGINRERLAHIGNHQIRDLLEAFSEDYLNIDLLHEIGQLLEKYRALGVKLDLWHSQNLMFEVGQQQFFIRNKMAERGEPAARAWIDQLKHVSALFDVRFE